MLRTRVYGIGARTHPGDLWVRTFWTDWFLSGSLLSCPSGFCGMDTQGFPMVPSPGVPTDDLLPWQEISANPLAAELRVEIFGDPHRILLYGGKVQQALSASFSLVPVDFYSFGCSVDRC